MKLSPVSLDVNEVMFTDTKHGRVSHVVLYKPVDAKGRRGPTEGIELKGSSAEQADDALVRWYEAGLPKRIVDDIRKAKPVEIPTPPTPAEAKENER